ncbi:MAG: C1 family peptidase [Chitinophagales bacterium]
MPIRMVEDNPGGGNKRKRPSNPGGGRRGGGSLITMLLPLLLKNPKLLLIAAVLFGLFYFFMPNQASSVVNSAFNTGMEIDDEVYQQAEIFEPLADNKKNPLPAQVSLLKYAPQRLNQGSQGSCVGWASSYAARTILYAKQTGQDPNQVRFSPSSLYNEIDLPNCQGAYVHTAMETMKKQGVLPFNQFPYDENSCDNELNSSQIRDAQQYTITGYNRLTKGSNARNLETDMLAIKQNLAQGAPVVIGMMVGGSFMQNMKGKDTWIPTSADLKQYGFGGHAMCVIGYDDYKDGGSFQLMNSWGSDWGNNGVAWVRYSDFSLFNKEAYGLFPMGDANLKESKILNLEFGLVNNTSKKHVNFIQKDKYLFKTASPIKKGDKFKVEVTNDATCYTYLFGEETDKSSYVLFPYTKKHSPYCGIVGTRLFPSDYSLQADNIGTKDYMAVLITKVPIDYDEVNKSINNAQGNTYYEKIKNFVGSNMIQANFKTGSNISFSGELKENNVVAVVMEIEKN